MTAATELRARIASLASLDEVFAALRAMAAARLVQADAKLDGARRHERAVTDAIRLALVLRRGEPPLTPVVAPARDLCVVIGAEHGFVRGLHDRLVERARGRLQHGEHLGVVGARTAAIARERGFALEFALPMATHADGALGAARRLADEIYRRIESGAALAVHLVAASRAGSTVDVGTRVLLPVALESFGTTTPAMPPLAHLPAAKLVERLVGEYVLARLALVLLESLAAENAARLDAMEAACDHVERRLDGLRSLEGPLRQEEITSELLDLVGGMVAAGV